MLAAGAFGFRNWNETFNLVRQGVEDRPSGLLERLARGQRARRGMVAVGKLYLFFFLVHQSKIGACRPRNYPSRTRFPASLLSCSSIHMSCAHRSEKKNPKRRGWTLTRGGQSLQRSSLCCSGLERTSSRKTSWLRLGSRRPPRPLTYISCLPFMP